MKKIALILFIFISFTHLQAQSDSVQVLTVQECVAIAIDNNLSVRRSMLARDGARISYNQARAAQLPSVNASGSYGYNFGRSIDPVTNQFTAQQIQFTSMGGNSSMTLFNWFRLTNTVRQNNYSLESSEFDVEKAKNDISLNIATFYLNVILNKELVQNAEYQLQSTQKQLERTKILVLNGSLARTNELDLISQVATNEVNLINAQNNLDFAFLSLKQAMLIPASQPFEIVIPDLVDMVDNSGSVPNADEVYVKALELMPEIKSAELDVKSAQLGVKVAEASYTPSVSLNGQMNTNYSNISEMVEPEMQDQFKSNLSKSVSVGVSVPIFNNLRTNGSVQRAKISLQQAEITHVETKNQLRQNIETAYNNAMSASKTFNASQKQVDALEETFRSMENQYNLGAANFTEYQVASNNLFRAKSDLVRAKYDFVFKLKILDFYQGIPPTF